MFVSSADFWMISRRAVSRETLTYPVCSPSTEQMERLSQPNFLPIAADPDTSQPTTSTMARRTVQLSLTTFLSTPPFFPLVLYLSPSHRLTHVHIRCRTYKGLTTAGKFTVVMKLSGGLSYIGALPQARQPIACGHYLSACRLHRLRYSCD